MISFKTAVFTVALFGVIQKGAAINCHQCNSWDGAQCGDRFEGLTSYDAAGNADNVDECGMRDTHCLKVKTTLKLYDSGFITGEPKRSIVVTRGCVTAPDAGEFCEAIDMDSGMQIRCLCSTDECNLAASHAPSLLLGLLSALTSWLLLKY
ncbi:uncharacterized protein LOC127835771 [Dreissena polymorpha]|uniref:Protein quiver n=1 Tax=Dreissena polymorpha TaxID=45954 RepID=A0A9D4RWG4_DREPO|nr:uncharacterized protein LOC127835771 [Dreissena polymorpha]KAH3883966.1 hypothetical protein DPMN_007936 [Dreissena polymorpha]